MLSSVSVSTTQRSRCSLKLMVWSVFLVLAVLVGAAQAADYAKLDLAVPNSTVSDIAPVFDFDDDGCLPSAGISRSGQQNPGLQTTNAGSITEGCRSTNFLDTSNTLHRHACANANGSTYCGHFYALYFEKDQTTNLGGGHTHDWEYAAVWTKDGAITHGSTSAHGDLHTRSRSDIQLYLNHIKVVYHKEGGLTHALRFADAGETGENPEGRFVVPTVISWYNLTGDGVSNASMRTNLYTYNYGDATIPMKDNNFYVNLNKWKPAGYPTFFSNLLDCQFTASFSEEAPSGQTCPTGYVVAGIKCSGSCCDNKELLCCQLPGRSPSGSIQYTSYFSEEGTNYYKNDSQAVVGMRCSGSRCDNISLAMMTLQGSGGTWSPKFSEEDGGMGECSNEGYVAGVRCSGSTCDNLELYCKN